MRDRRPRRGWPRWSDRADLALGPLLGIATLLDAGAAARTPAAWAWTSVGAVACTIAVMSRARLPVAALVTLTAVLLVAHLGGGRTDQSDISLLMVMLLVYTAGARAPLRFALFGVAVAVAGAELLAALEPGFDPAPIAVLLIPTFGVGRGLRRWRLLALALDEQTAALEAERDTYAALAVRDERARIARELHDVVGHAVSLMVIQASAGRRVAATQPDRATTTLGAIEAAGAQALGELSHLAGLLAPSAPEVPGRSVTELVTSARSAGLEIRLRCATVDDDELDPLAFRVIQEALTNALKHAGPTHVDISLSRELEVVHVRVVDQGRPLGAVAPVSWSGGHGLAGMRERLALAGGTLTAGPTAVGGWEVSARIPASAAVGIG